MKIKAKDIALRLGVSPATVSNALNGRGGVGDELRTRILRTAMEMGYDTGRNTPERKPYIRMLIMKTAGSIIMDTQFFSELFESIQAECQRNGLELVMNHIYIREDSSWQAQLAEYSTERCTGILVLATEIGEETVPFFHGFQSPVLSLDNLFFGAPMHSVVMDNFEAGSIAARELYDLGHRAIAHITSAEAFSNAAGRKLGYTETMRSLGLEDCCDFWPVRPTLEGAYQDMKALLESGRALPTAFFACNDIMAIGAIRAMQERGLRIPEDISIIGMDDTDLCLACTPQLTTVHVYRREMGRAAVRTLITALPEAEPGCWLKTNISVSLVRRDSAGRIGE